MSEKPRIPGPKRDDPLRIAALRAHGQRQMELERIAEHRVRGMLVQIGCRVRVVIKGNQTLQGRVVGEDVFKGRSKAKDTPCWLVETSKGTRLYAKGHCERIKGNEASKTLRHLGRNKPKPEGPEDIYGDGDI